MFTDINNFKKLLDRTKGRYTLKTKLSNSQLLPYVEKEARSYLKRP